MVRELIVFRGYDTERFQGKPSASLRPKMSVVQLSPSPRVGGSEWQGLSRRLKAWVPGGTTDASPSVQRL